MLVDNVGLPADPTIAVGVPNVIDAANGDYRLRYSRAGGVTTMSLGLDFARRSLATMSTFAPRHTTRIWPASPTRQRDLGAIEVQNYADRVFVDAFGDALLAFE